ncbi:MAG TPA: proton-conducting transporter membrane subunit, partial [bacterium]|nr:proton-conducting transporter membrane subunit [bacterium]
LGYMVMALGLRSSEAGMFHLTTHAFFKALLFLGAGSLIHALHTQDIWKMAETSRSSLFKKMPVTTVTFLIGTLALMGIPPTSGFFSKEEILTMASTGPAVLFFLAVTTVFLTAFYMGRVVAITFLGGSQSSGEIPAGTGKSDVRIHEPNLWMLLPLILLALLSIIGGYLPIRDLLPDRSVFEESHKLTQLSIGLAAAGFFIAVLFYRVFPKTFRKSFEHSFSIPRRILERKYFFDDVYDWLIRNVQDNTARFSDLFERWVIVKTLVNGTARTVRSLGDLLRGLQTGVVQFYGLLFTAGITLLVFFLIFWRAS